MTAAMVAGSGGHLAQLKLFAPRLAGGEDIVWVTDPTPQSRSLLRDEQVLFLPHRAPRDIVGVIRDSWRARALFEQPITAVYSTGAGIALSVLLPSLVRRIPFTYIESATRIDALSLTGRLLDRVPRVRRYVQHESLASKRWAHFGSVFDSFVVTKKLPLDRPLRVFVTVGANQQTGFASLIDTLVGLIPSDWETRWQYGPTDVSAHDLIGEAMMDWTKVEALTRWADVVVSHAGTGSILTTISNGTVPIVVPRDANAGEHVDNHQGELAQFADRLGLAIMRDVGSLTVDDFYLASSFRVDSRY